MKNQDKPVAWYDLASRSAAERAKDPAPSPTLEEAKTQARVLVPLLRAFRKEIGDERANKIAWGALAEWRRQIWQGMNLPAGTPAEKFHASSSAMATMIGDAVDVEMLKEDADAVEFNVVSCRYAQFFRELGEPELGFALTCSFDETFIEEFGGGDVTLKRTGTIMRGADHCDFRYALKKAGRR